MPTAEARLAGLRVLVTRPAHQAAGLVARIHNAGGEALRFPTLEIAPLTPPAEQVARLSGAGMLIFASVNAVSHGLPLLGDRAPRARCILAIGAATRRALEARGWHDVHSSSAPGATSEDLLALPVLRHVSGETVCILRGRGGRETLAQTLGERGARVDYLDCYERRRPAAPDPGLLVTALEHAADELVISVTSVTGLEALLELTPPAHRAALQRQPLVVIGARQGDAARARGWHGAIVVAGASDAMIVEAIATWHSQQ